MFLNISKCVQICTALPCFLCHSCDHVYICLCLCEYWFLTSSARQQMFNDIMWKNVFRLNMVTKIQDGGSCETIFHFWERVKFSQASFAWAQQSKNTQNISLYSNHRDKIYIDTPFVSSVRWQASALFPECQHRMTWNVIGCEHILKCIASN